MWLGRAFFGLLLLGAGVLLLLNMLGVTSISAHEILSSFKQWWPALVILAGLSRLSHGRYSRGAIFSGLIITAVGGFFLAKNMGFIDVSSADFFHLAIPVVLIAAGISVIVRPSRRREERRRLGTAPLDPMVPSPPPRPLDPNFSPDFKSTVDEAFEQAFPEEARKHKTGNGAGTTFADFEPRKEQPTDHIADARNPHEMRMERHMQRRLRHAQRHAERTQERIRAHKEKAEKHHMHGTMDEQEEKIIRSGFIGDVRVGDHYFELKPTTISHFIGDTVIDLTKAQIPYGETKIHVSAFIGDVKIFIPTDADLGVEVISSSGIGDMKVLKEDQGGFMSSITFHTPNYNETSKRIKLNVSVLIGDIRINAVS